MAASSVRLILVRHGESVLGRARRYAGHRDTPLTAEGRLHISRLRSQFRRLRPELIFSSDLRRCRQTARILSPDGEIRTSPRLRELDFGAWDGRTADSCRRRDPDRFDRWMRDPWSVRPPRGESLSRLWRRVRTFVASLARSHPRRTLAIITHGGPIRALLAADRGRFWSIDVPPGALITLRWDSESGATRVKKGR